MPHHVHLLANKRDGTLHLGVTRDLGRRVREPERRLTPGFSSEHGIDRLVRYEACERADEAIAREKAVEKWRRAWKTALVEADNPGWSDLYPSPSR